MASSTSVQFFFLEIKLFSSLTVARKLLLFYHATRCIHCQRLEPTLEAAAKILHSSHTDASERKVKVGKIDGATERALASRFNIRGFPSIFLIDGWEVREYEGPRTVSFFSFNCWKCWNLSLLQDPVRAYWLCWFLLLLAPTGRQFGKICVKRLRQKSPDTFSLLTIWSSGSNEGLVDESWYEDVTWTWKVDWVWIVTCFCRIPPCFDFHHRYLVPSDYRWSLVCSKRERGLNLNY